MPQDHPWRPVFYGVHSSLGYGSIALALAAVYLTRTLANPQDQVGSPMTLTLPLARTCFHNGVSSLPSPSVSGLPLTTSSRQPTDSSRRLVKFLSLHA